MPRASSKADELELLSRAVVGGVITTNYDGLIETLLPEYRTYVGQGELLTPRLSRPRPLRHPGGREIYKIQGSDSQPESLGL